jgi:hypothetical protein
VTGRDSPDRRMPLVADRRRAPVLVSRMSPADQDRFHAQLAAFLAAVEYVNAVTLNVTYGVPVSSSVVDAWTAARNELHFHNSLWRYRGGQR